MSSQQRYTSKVRIDETTNFFEQKVLKLLNLKSLPETLGCNWEAVYKTLSISGKSMADHLVTATAHQDLCLASVIIHTGEVPGENIITSAASGDNAILNIYLSSRRARVPYQALLNAIDSNKEDNVKSLLQDGRVPVSPPTANQPDALATAVKKNYSNIVRTLLMDDRVDPSGSDNKALWTAAYYNNVSMLKLLLDGEADPNIKESPFVAATVGNLEAVKFLLSDPRVDYSAIPVRTLRLMENNRASKVTQHTVNRDLPAKSAEVFNTVAEAMNMALYGDKISGLFLGYYLAEGKIDSDEINKILTGKNMHSRFLRHLALEKSLGDSLRWILEHKSEFTPEERLKIEQAAAGNEQEVLKGDIPIAAFFLLTDALTFQEIFEEVRRQRHNENDVLMTALFLGAHLGFERSLSSGIRVPPNSVLREAEAYTKKTNFSILRPQ